MLNRKRRQALFSECHETLRPMLWRLTGAFTPPREREDLLQEIYLQLWLALPEFAGRSKLSTWAYRVALNTALKWARQRSRIPPTETMEDHRHHLEAPSPDDSASRLSAVHAALRSLGEADRAVLLLALEEVPRREMARALGISENATHVRLHRARQRLNLALQENPL